MSYLTALEQLRRIISEDYRDGGLLPGHREMSKKLGVSIKTYGKAIQLLVKDGTIADAKSKVGTYVSPAYARTKKIGVVLGDGGESPFFQDDGIFAGMVAPLHQDGYTIHILQAAKIDQIQDVALQHGVQAIIWIHPAISVIPVMEQIQTDRRFPLLIAFGATCSYCKEVLKHDLNVITANPKHHGIVLSDYLKMQQHNKIIFIGEPDDAKSKLGQKCPLERCIDRANVKEQLLETLRTIKTTCIVAGGGARIYRQIAEVLSEIPEDKRPELVLDGIHNKNWQIPKVTIKVSYVGPDSNLIGRVIADSLCKYLLKGEPLKTEFVPCYRLVSD